VPLAFIPGESPTLGLATRNEYRWLIFNSSDHVDLDSYIREERVK